MPLPACSHRRSQARLCLRARHLAHQHLQGCSIKQIAALPGHLNRAPLLQMLSGGEGQEQRLKGINERILQRTIPIEEVRCF